MIIGNKQFELDKKTYIMGILNVTPDSFSDGGNYTEKDAIIRHALQMIEDGADIIDIGGMSTRPGHEVVSPEEETERVINALGYIRNETDIPISIDTYRAEVARESIKCGADLINDIWGLKENTEIAGVIAKAEIPCCLMHNRDIPYDGKDEEGLLKVIEEDIYETLKIADAAGINRDLIILDPGVGFGKTFEHNLITIKNLDFFNKFNLPMLLGTSRKSVIGNALNLPVNEREEGTLVTTVLAASAHYGFVRVHDVKANKRAISMYEAIVNSGR